MAMVEIPCGTKATSHTKRIRGCLFGLVHPFLLMNRTGHDGSPQLAYSCVHVGAMESVTRPNGIRRERC
jgi:hypothetical protein